MLRLTALNIKNNGAHQKIFDYAEDGWTRGDGDKLGHGDANSKNVNSVAMLHVADGDAFKSYLIANVDNRVCNMSPEAWGFDPAAGKTTGSDADENPEANCVDGLLATDEA